MVGLHDILIEAADAALAEMASDGSMPAGDNGPWENPQTPVRNTGHWVVSFLHCYERTGAERFRTAAEQAVSFLCSEEARPYGETYYHLKEHEKSRCNGLIGQAWTIEALVNAADSLDRPELLSIAEDVFLLHPFDDSLSAWRYVDIDGEFSTLDKTFNHQLWFAMAGGLLIDRNDAKDSIQRQVHQFLDDLSQTLNLYESGLIYHPFKPEFTVRKYGKVFLEGLRSGVAHKMILNLARGSLSDDDNDPMKQTSIGYHTFNLYAFAVLRECFPDHEFWRCDKFQRAIEYAQTEEFEQAVDGNPYGYPYNLTGIEMAYVLDVFGEASTEKKEWWLDQQFKRTYDPNHAEMSRNNPDPATLTARLYEGTRLPNLEISLEHSAKSDA